jgi:hypothetical protein
VNKHATLLLQKTTAGFFLLLFLFIHGAKLIHQHDYQQTVAGKITDNKTNVASAECAVCDYYFVKDSHNETASITIETLVADTPSYSGFLSQQITSIGLASSDRGPPSLV